MEFYRFLVAGLLLIFNSELCIAQNSTGGSPVVITVPSAKTTNNYNPDFWEWLNSQDRLYPLKSVDWVLYQLRELNVNQPFIIKVLGLSLTIATANLDRMQLGPLGAAFNSIFTPLWRNLVKIVFIVSAFLSGYFFKSLYAGEYLPLQEYFMKFVRDLPNLGPW